MRARGAQATDIAVIVVAADDGVKPQTREAVDHAKAAEVPMLVAVNKIDKEGAQPDRVRTEMTQLGLQPEEWGGDTMFVDVSAKTRQGLDDLLESILLLAEVEELKANPEAEASGVVIESRLDPGRGATVTVLVQRGTLHVGDAVVAGAHWGRVRAMYDFMGNRVKQATPSEPVDVLGFNVRPVGDARALADREGVEIRTYSVIYRAIDELRDAMQGMLAPETVEDTVGTVEVRQIFRASRVGTIAGSYVTDGRVARGGKVRLVRDGTVVYDGEIASLRRGSDDVREVAAGFECGIVLSNYADVK